MCGIAGFFNYRTNRPADEKGLLALLESMRYRGPDHLGTYCDNDIAIGNVRLAIQDISDRGNQPIYNEDRTVVVVYNGEIYNFPEMKEYLKKKGHSFRTNADTELLVHLYEESGTGLADDLNGMFAFALFDIKKKVLILSRDRTAQKPLFINRNKDGIFFSSELKAMMPYLDKRSLDHSSVGTFLSIGYTLEPKTILKEVEAVEPGYIYAFGPSGESVKRFWHIPAERTEKIRDLRAWNEEADSVIQKAANRSLLSDVPVTLLLSGGVDSSLLAVYLREANRITKAFTGSFPENKDHDEYDYALKLGRYCGFKVERVSLSNQTLADNLEGFLKSSSQPQGDYSGLATYCMAKEISKEYRVVLGGDGGDELFGGYPTYTFPYISRRYSFIPGSAIALAHRLSSLVCDKKKYLSLPFKLQQLSLAWNEDIIKAHFLLKNFLPESLALDVMEKSFFWSGGNDETGPESIFEKFYNAPLFDDPIHKLCWVDFNTFLRSGTIPKLERNSMSFSLETRMPYLDNDILDLSRRTDPSLLVHKSETKKCLKSLLRSKVDGKVGFNPIKQGFSPPLVDLFGTELKSWKEHWLSVKTPYLKPGTPSQLMKWERKGWDLHRLEWNICALNDWCRRNSII
ncbi:MAG: asparagine synthase (glutamine-hydrolyzing) [Candidatus Omnitrophica bacterium]|nr:asparagine synthase (glutamine-hydrolyzing) [Candidatus Omnitrophota bacterium]